MISQIHRKVLTNLDNNARTSGSGQMETEIKSSVLALPTPAQWPVGNTKGLINLSRVGSRAERTEAWR